MTLFAYTVIFTIKMGLIAGLAAYFDTANMYDRINDTNGSGLKDNESFGGIR